jgi:hypothetical protein
MARIKKTQSETKVESIRHKDKRKNIPTEELRDFIADDEAAPKTMLYPREPGLDPQLVWKGKDEMANYALLAWPGNIDISDSPPSEYVPAIKERFSSSQWAKMHEAHALPEGWDQMDYAEFLVRRRQLMASIIRRGFETLT